MTTANGILDASALSDLGAATFSFTGLSTTGGERVPMSNTAGQGTRTIWELARILGGAWNDLAAIDVFVDPVNGNDANPGTFDLPKKTPDAVVQSPGLTIGYKRGTQIRSKHPQLNYDGMRIVAYGPANLPRPCFDPSLDFDATFTATGTANVWSAPSATQPSMVAIVTSYAEGGCNKLERNTATPTTPPGGIVTGAALSGTLSSYTSGATIVFDPPPYGGRRATGTVSGTGAGMTVTITDPGYGYTYEPGAYLIPTGGVGNGGVAKAAVSVGQWGWSANTLYLYSETDPNTLDVRIQTTGSNVGIQISAADCLVQDIAVWLADTDAAFAGERSVVRGCDLSYSAGDGWGASFAKDWLLTGCRLVWNGVGPRDGTGPAGDGASPHGDGGANFSRGVMEYNFFQRNRKSGIGGQSSSTIDAYGNYIDNCYWGLAIFVTAYTGPGTMRHRYWNNVIINRQNDADASWVMNVAPTVPFAVEIYNNTFVCMQRALASGGQARGLRPADSAFIRMRIYNNVWYGYNKAWDIRGGVVLDVGNNAFFLNVANFDDNGTNYLVGKTGSNNVLTDPKFVSQRDAIVRPQLTSPLINAGFDVGLREDHRRRPVTATTVPIGAYGVA